MFTAILAQDPAPQAPAGGEQAAAPFWMNPLFLMGMMVLFFFVVMWPAQRRAKREQANMLANLKSGAKVVLSSGIVGTVVKVHDTEGEITIRSDDTKLRVLRTAVASVRGEESTEVKA
jgi:preprotein translocase subunit YajC